MAVLGETLERLRCLSFVPTNTEPELASHLENSEFRDIVMTLQSQWQLEESLKMLTEVHQPISMITPPSGNSKGHNVTDQTLDVQLQMISNTRQLCRQLRDESDSLSIFHSHTSGDQAEQFLAFVHSLTEMTESTYRKLSCTVEDENSQRSLIADATQREKGADQDRSNLQEQLNSELKDKEDELGVLVDKFAKLNRELQDIQSKSAVETSVIDKETKDKVEKATTEHKTVMERLTAQLAKLEEAVVTMAHDHGEAEKTARKKKHKLETEVQGWIQKYDEDMAKTTTEMEEVQTNFDKEKAELLELEEYFRKIDAENKRIKEEDRIIAEALAKEMAALKKVADAASTMMKLMRGYMARKETAKLKGKKKGKGKKGKKR